MKFKLTPLEKKWVLYDVANSAFTLLVSTIMPIYFNYLAGRGGLSSVDYLGDVVRPAGAEETVLSGVGSDWLCELCGAGIYAVLALVFGPVCDFQDRLFQQLSVL